MFKYHQRTCRKCGFELEILKKILTFLDYLFENLRRPAVFPPKYSRQNLWPFLTGLCVVRELFIIFV